MKDLNCDNDRSGHAHGRGLRPLDGPRGEGVSAMAIGKRTKQTREGVDPRQGSIRSMKR